MAEPTADELNALKESADQASASLNTLTGFSFSTQTALGALQEQVTHSISAFSGFDSALKSVGLSLNATGALTDKQMTQFSLLSNFVLGAKESYTSLANVDTTGLNTFNSQIDQLMTTLSQKGTAPALTAQAMSSLAEGLAKAGRPVAEIEQAMKGGIATLGAYAKNVMTSADNALRLQNAFIQLSAQTGNLDEVTKLAGDRFENINALIEKQSHMMARAEMATGATADEVSKYYAMLGSVPGALQSVVTSSGDAAESTEMLTATMKVARGTGRNFTDIVEDMKVAFREYGLVGEDALKFSTRISEITQHLGVEFSTVQNAIRGTADVFRMYTNAGADALRMTEGAADILNSYSQALKSTGLSGTVAVDVVKNMTSQIDKMGIAQKSFLSAQTGGAGGLMGAFQVDKMMREGKIDQVFEKVRQQMQKQFGKIVTLDEASQSQGAAAQMTKQMMILKQGPLGQFARSDAEAQRILEGFKARESGKVSEKGLADDIVGQSMDKGTALQEKSYTAVNQILGHVSAIRKAADMGTLKFMQQGMTAGQGSPMEDKLSKSQKANMANLKAGMTGATVMDTDEMGASYAGAMKTGELTDTLGRSAANAIKGFKTFIKGAGDAINAPMDALKDAIGMGDTKAAIDRIKILQDDIKKRKADMSKLSLDKRQQAMDTIAKEEAIVKTASDWVKSKGATVDMSQVTGGAKVQPPGAKVGAAVPKGTGTGVVPGAPPGGGLGTAGGAGAPGGPFKQDVTVHVTGFCLKCKQEIDNNAQAKAGAPQAQ